MKTTKPKNHQRYCTSAIFGLLSLTFYSHVDADPAQTERKSRTETDAKGYTTTYLFQQNPQYGVFELKEKDKGGNVTQWYQHFVDSDGKEIIEIDRVVPGVKQPPYQTIQLTVTYQYNKDRNVSESFEFFGDGTLRQHVVYIYDTRGNWLEGDIYDPSGKAIGKELTPPESHLYGKYKDQ